MGRVTGDMGRATLPLLPALRITTHSFPGSGALRVAAKCQEVCEGGVSFQQMGNLGTALFVEFVLHTKTFTYVIISYLILTIALKVSFSTPALPFKKTGIQRS